MGCCWLRAGHLRAIFGVDLSLMLQEAFDLPPDLPLEEAALKYFADTLEQSTTIAHPTETRSILDIMDEVFAEHFAEPTWAVWRVFLAALYGLPFSEVERHIFTDCTGRNAVPTAPAHEAWMIVGRRGGKSRIAALLAVYMACFRHYALNAGERGIVMIIAADRRQARVVLRYILALLHTSPALEAQIKSERNESIDLTNGITIEMHTASFRTVRGYTIVGLIADEIAFWPTDDAADPDREILAAVRPAMATVPGALLVALSSPYARRGELWRMYRERFGHPGDVLVWKASTLTMNASVPSAVIDAAYVEDNAAASAEYGAEFRRDIETFIDEETLAALVVRGRDSLLVQRGWRYVAFADPAGGSGGDSFTLAVAHMDAKGRGILDFLAERQSPFSPETVVTDFSQILKLYGIFEVTSDRYAGDWPVEQWKKYGVICKPSERTKSEIYGDFLPLLNSSQVELLDHKRLVRQLVTLERRTGRSGKDSIDHAPGGHDDVANAAAGALVLCALSPAPAQASTMAISGW